MPLAEDWPCATSLPLVWSLPSSLFEVGGLFSGFYFMLTGFHIYRENIAHYVFVGMSKHFILKRKVLVEDNIYAGSTWYCYHIMHPLQLSSVFHSKD
jgi:hypothetical protein